MGTNTIIMLNQTSVDKKVRSEEHMPIRVNKFARIVIDQILWFSALVLLVDMAVKNKKRQVISWWAAN